MSTRETLEKVSDRFVHKATPTYQCHSSPAELQEILHIHTDEYILCIKRIG